MGKGNRTRQERANQVLSAPTIRKTQKKKRELPTWVGTLIVVGVLAVLLIFIGALSLNRRGTFSRMQTVAESENYKISGTMMTYAVYAQRQNLISMYQQYSSSSTAPKIGGGKNGDPLNTATMDLRSQVYERDDEGNVTKTWFDHFAASAEEYVKQLLACCEMADYYGMALTEEDYATIDQTVESLDTYAAQYGYSTNAYVAAMYGEGVNARDMRKMMELERLASKYTAVRNQEVLNAITDLRIQEQYAANPSAYDKYMDYIGYTFEAKFTPATPAEGEETADQTEALAAYAALQAKYAARVEALAKAPDAKAFNALLYGYLYEDAYEEALTKEKNTALETKKKNADENTDPDTITLTPEEIEACENKAAKKADGTAMSKLTAAAVTDFSGKDSTDKFEKWLFETKKEKDDEGKEISVHLRRPGDATKFVDATNAKADADGKYKSVKSTYSAYVVTGAIHRESSVVRDAGHILFASKTYDGLTNTDSLTGKVKELADRVLAKQGVDMLTAYAMAIELLDMLYDEGKITAVTKDGKTYYTVDEAVFEEYGLLYTEDGNVFYDEVAEGQMVDEFESWLFDAARVVGEISYPEPVTSKDYGCHIMMYRGEGLAWRSTIRSSLGSSDYQAWLTDFVKGASVEIHANKWKCVKG
ncbi:MAG: hypothetical protein IJA78_02060 [Clostridia bacterium]|nr:hypothetical protein [Clostridia bacterium]